MPKGQHRVYGKGHLHFISCQCYRGQPKLAIAKHRDLLLQLLEELRVKFQFRVVGYVVMPEHFDLLMAEPAIDTVENSIAMLRKRYGRRYNTSAGSDEQTWKTRYEDVHIFDPLRTRERIDFMHQEPVKADLVETPTEWAWSSARAYSGLDQRQDGDWDGGGDVVTVDPQIDPKALVKAHIL